MKALNVKEKQELLSLDKKDLSISKITELFGTTTTINLDFTWTAIPPKYDTRSKLHLDAGEYINIEAIDTTVGSFLFNKLMVEGTIEQIIPNHYFNEVVDKKGFKKITSLISTAVMMKKLPVEPNLIEWLRNYEFYGLKASTIFSPSYSEALLREQPAVSREKAKLLKDKEIKNASDMTDIEEALVAKSREALKNDSGMTLYNSGARGAFDNDYKNMNLMVGPVAIPGKDGEFSLMKSNYIDGIQKEDWVAAGNSIVNATHPKAVGTQEAGYRTKQYYAAYQSIQLDEDETDCGSTRGLELILTGDNIADYHYQNIFTRGGGHVLLTPDNEKEFLNKKVKIRTPMFCHSDKICSVCAGRRFYIMGIQNAGLTTGRVTNNMLNASMKNFHIAKVKFDDVDVEDLLL